MTWWWRMQTRLKKSSTRSTRLLKTHFLWRACPTNPSRKQTMKKRKKSESYYCSRSETTCRHQKTKLRSWRSSLRWSSEYSPKALSARSQWKSSTSYLNTKCTSAMKSTFSAGVAHRVERNHGRSKITRTRLLICSSPVVEWVQEWSP